MSSRCNPVIFFILFFLSLSLFQFASPFEFQAEEDVLLWKGQLTIEGQSLHYERTDGWLRVLDENGVNVFAWEVEDRDTIIKGVDYSETRRGFVFFTETFEPESRVYSLVMQGPSSSILVTNRSEKASYSPILIEENDGSETVVYIEEGGTLVTFDPGKRLVLDREAFDKPIFDLGKRKIEGVYHLTFTLYEPGIACPFMRRFQRISPRKPPLIPLERQDEMNLQLPSEDDRDEPPVRMPLDPKAILGFGDSITYGKVGRILDENLGYVPRLERMVNREFFPDGDGMVINEGNPAETIHAYKEKLDEKKNKYATFRYKRVLEERLVQYLLLHEGTNDTRFYDYDLQLVYNDLQWMVDLALDMGIQPVLSTLIPKDLDYYPKVRALDLERGRKISVFIRALGEELDLPVVDFWEIFSNHPDGYKSLMSDYVHPGEKGYQVMAEEWLKALQGLEGPLTPTGIEIIEATPSQITIQWDGNTAGDFSHFVLEYGFAEDSLDRVAALTDAYYTFYYNILQSPFRSRIYFRLKAMDKAGNSSPFTEVRTATFPAF